MLYLGNDGVPVFELLRAIVGNEFISCNFHSDCCKSLILTKSFPDCLPGAGDLEIRKDR